jgi:hypothetical protein
LKVEQPEHHAEEPGATGCDGDLGDQDDLAASLGSLGKILDLGFETRDLVGCVIVAHQSQSTSGGGHGSNCRLSKRLSAQKRCAARRTDRTSPLFGLEPVMTPAPLFDLFDTSDLARRRAERGRPGPCRVSDTAQGWSCAAGS